MFPLVALGDIVYPATGSKNPSLNPNKSFWYVDVAAIDNKAKIIVGAKKLIGAEAPSRARKLIRANDILVSTVRPILNAVSLVPPVLDGEVASTGFCVLRATPDVLPEYLFFFVRSQRFTQNLSQLVVGAMYPAVSDKQILAQILPLPPLDEQRRIVDILSRAEGIVRLRREAQKKTAELIPALFLDMFGDPVTNPKSWPTLAVGDFVARFEGGKNVQSGEDGESEFRILKVSAVTSGNYIETEAKPAPLGYTPPNSYFIKEGDLLFSRANTEQLVGATALVESTNGKTLLPDKLWRFVWKDNVPVASSYVRAVFQNPNVRTMLSRIASGTSGSMKNISQKKLFEVSIPFAPYPRQLDFENKAQLVRSIASQQSIAMQKAEATFNALLAQAFSK